MKMTREQFVERAVRALEQAEDLPRGWWGRYRDAHGPGSVRVFFSAGAWTLSVRGRRVSRHDSRRHALRVGAAVARGGAR